MSSFSRGLWEDVSTRGTKFPHVKTDEVRKLFQICRLLACESAVLKCYELNFQFVLQTLTEQMAKLQDMLNTANKVCAVNPVVIRWI